MEKWTGDGESIMRPIPFDCGVLQRRRRELGLSYELLARRSGVSRPTVQRILSGRYPTASLASVVAIGDALGLELRFAPVVSSDQLRREQARKKAKKLAALVQGTCALEGQGVDRAGFDAMVERTTHELLSGSKRRLWSEL
jgi:transcriptional regulator with XRE-family HTH domain